jgi:hypothetical protein
MTPTEMFEAHFWKMFDTMRDEFFMDMSGLSETKYAALKRYRRGETTRRPIGTKKIVELRSRLLDKLEAFEKENVKGILQ